MLSDAGILWVPVGHLGARHRSRAPVLWATCTAYHQPASTEVGFFVLTTHWWKGETMLKVHILTQCTHCKGEAYLPAGEADNHKGEKYTRYLPCPVCEGSGN